MTSTRTDSPDADVEREVREALADGSPEGLRKGVERALDHFGQRLCAFILNLVKDPTVAADVQQDLWLTVFRYAPSFRWESSLKGWLYLLARRAAIRAAQRDVKRARGAVPLSRAAESKLKAHMTSSIAMWRRDDFKARIRALRQRLSEKDQTLLVMRADQELPFREIALALAEPDEALEGKELARREATLMKRFQRVKQRLYQLAVEDGLISPEKKQP